MAESSVIYACRLTNDEVDTERIRMHISTISLQRTETDCREDLRQDHHARGLRESVVMVVQVESCNLLGTHLTSIPHSLSPQPPIHRT